MVLDCNHARNIFQVRDSEMVVFSVAVIGRGTEGAGIKLEYELAGADSTRDLVIDALLRALVYVKVIPKCAHGCVGQRIL